VMLERFLLASQWPVQAFMLTRKHPRESKW
jgi:hypothetical protein